MKVLMLTAFPAAGGPLPKLAPVVADELAKRGWDVKVRGWSAHSADQERLADKVLGRSRDLARVRALAAQWHPDVVYVATTHDWPALLRDIPLALSFPRRAPPLVLHLHGSESGRLGSPGQRLFTSLSRFLMQRVSAVLVLSSEELLEWLSTCPRGRFGLVTNPFISSSPPATQVRPGRDAQTVLFVGRLVAEKGVFDLIDAVRIVKAHRPCRLVVAGTGRERDSLMRRVHQMGLEEDVSLAGYITGSQLDAAYRSADVFALPSYREGFPHVIMEAMDNGLPIITSPIRGCADHLTAPENALFVPPGAPEDLARAIERLLDDAALRAQMRDANRAKIGEFAPARVIPAYEEFLKCAIQRAASHRDLCRACPGDQRT
jgi:glycosyltransferase involved in cell wall biosynthesis